MAAGAAHPWVEEAVALLDSWLALGGGRYWSGQGDIEVTGPWGWLGGGYPS